VIEPAAQYAAKKSGYFAGARHDYVDELEPSDSAVLLEVGCGHGDTGALAKQEGKCRVAYGVELEPAAAAIAAGSLDDVVVGDVEALALPWPTASIDILILSEVLEHLRDPWAVLRRLHGLLGPEAIVFASSPNVAHHRIVRHLVAGRWDLTDSGPMDRTHLRWFTPSSYRTMFEDCGYTVTRVGPVDRLGPKAHFADALTLGRLRHLFAQQIDLRARPK
jgi:SAM-dependent methyltransferase